MALTKVKGSMVDDSGNNLLPDVGEVTTDMIADGAVTAAKLDASLGSGDVSGPGSTSDNLLVRMDGTTGKIIQDTGITVDDSDNITGVVDLTYTGDLIGTDLTASGAAGVLIKNSGGATVLTSGAGGGTAATFAGTLTSTGLLTASANLTVDGQGGSPQNTLTDGVNISWDLDDGNAATVTLAGNRTLDNPTNQIAGHTYIVIVKQDATGSRTLAYGSNYKWPGGTAPTLTTTANAVDVLAFVSDGTNMYGVSQLDFQ